MNCFRFMLYFVFCLLIFMYDVVVIGAGAAGLSAALWCDELGLRTLVLERSAEIGGQLSWIHNPIENHLGVISVKNGGEMRELFCRQIEQRNFELSVNCQVERVNLEAKQIQIDGGQQISARSLIIATGLRRRQLSVPGEVELRGRGVMSSGRLDGAAFAGKDVCVVGGGDAAIENALLLAEVCRSVVLVHRGTQLRARPSFVNQLAANKRISVLTEAVVRRIVGTDEVEAVEVERHSQVEVIPISGVLVRIGYTANTELFQGQARIDKGNYLQVTNEGETSVRNVFAIGDVANPLAPTLSGATGAGATAAKVLAARLHKN